MVTYAMSKIPGQIQADNVEVTCHIYTLTYTVTFIYAFMKLHHVINSF